jgi:hypothetical protein
LITQVNPCNAIKYSVAAWPEFDGKETVQEDGPQESVDMAFRPWCTDRPTDIEDADFHDAVTFVTLGKDDRRPLLMFDANLYVAWHGGLQRRRDIRGLQECNPSKIELIDTQIDVTKRWMETERARRTQLEDGLGDPEELRPDRHSDTGQAADKARKETELREINQVIMESALCLHNLQEQRRNVEREMEVAKDEYRAASEGAQSMIERAMIQAKCLPPLDGPNYIESNDPRSRARELEHTKNLERSKDDQQGSHPREDRHSNDNESSEVVSPEVLIETLRDCQQNLNVALAQFAFTTQNATYQQAFEKWKIDNELPVLLFPPVFLEDAKLGPEERLEATFGRVWFETCRAATQNVSRAEKAWEDAKKKAQDAGIDLTPEAGLPQVGYSVSLFNSRRGLLNEPLKRKRLEEWRPVGPRHSDSYMDKPPSPDRSQASIESLPSSASRHGDFNHRKRQRTDKHNKGCERDFARMAQESSNATRQKGQVGSIERSN